MELVFFDDIPAGIDVDFLSEELFKKEKLANRQFQVLEVVKAQSGKGYCLKTELFMHFVWKNDKTTKFLIEALETWVKKGEGKPIYVCLGKTYKDKPRLASDKAGSCNWFSNGKKYTLEEITDTDTTSEVNPFL